MKKITFLLVLMLVVTLTHAQSLPLDFEVAEDDAFNAFNGATASVVTDPTDGTNSVLELVSNGNDFDGASITLDTYIDLSDDANNTITMQFWTPDAMLRTHLLKIESSPSAAPVELYFDTNADGWQTVSLDFGPGLSDDYQVLTLFADSGAGNTATGTYYIDDIDGPNGIVIPTDPIPASPAPVPTVANGETYSIYNDTNNYTNFFPVAYDFGTLAGEPDLDQSSAVNKAYKFNFGVSGWGLGEGGPDDVSAYDFVSFDYWASTGTIGFRFVLISNDGAVSEFNYEIGDDEAIVTDSWQKVEIPMTFFTSQGFVDTALFQWKFDPYQQSVDNEGIVYIDNILLTQNTTLSKDSFSQAEFKVFPNPSSSTWNISTSESIKSVHLYNITGRLVQEVNVNANEAVINTDGLSSGVYLAKVLNEFNQTKTIKLIKK